MYNKVTILIFTAINLFLGAIYNLFAFEVARGSFFHLGTGSTIGQAVVHILCQTLFMAKTANHLYCTKLSFSKWLTLPFDLIPIYTIFINYLILGKSVSRILRIRQHSVMALGFVINLIPLFIYFMIMYIATYI